MTDLTAMRRPAEPDWSTVTTEELIAFRDAENHVRASTAARVITGEPDPGVTIEWQQVALPGRELPVRVYRPLAGGVLPLVLHVHGGGFVGTAPQSDWVNSHLAARLPALVVSVEHRLLDWETPLSAAVQDGWDVLRHVVDDAAAWGVDPARVAVFGESCGGLICALAAVRAGGERLPLRAQVLVNPAVDVASTALDYDSVARYPDTPTLTVPQLRFFQRLAVPEGADARALSPLYAGDLDGLAPALVVVPTHDPIADHGRRYAERLQAAGTSARLSEYPAAGHAFLSMPGMAPQATPARAEILAFLQESLSD
ncbi:alpha/beta hydrolase [Nonomuraea gerenzanensis]|uniref:Alpha/beta hydrolase fold-3 domain protein n=1 Tax=Nonomuraea gerenzanensis TaxID=93944 RepID=A0A1M4EM08_9ACTN|nr:alpha/beta hydrolase [Nonomuraea gerenzanensis]UBU11403.1 alpha/beta hydrolase [Nonomuraea gerenzanensis]SBO99886.1 Alpha/beta hydrolase fold-3 domain protein [Nonomuraea gerenzanensis]